MNDFAGWAEIARKEITQHFRTKRLYIIGGLFVVAAVILTVVFPLVLVNALGGAELFDELEGNKENFLFSILLVGFVVIPGAMFFIQLLGITITADAVTAERSQGTLYLLLSKPVGRLGLVLGKFVGSVVAVAVAFGAVAIFDYIIIQFYFEGNPTLEEVGRFLGAVGLMLLGAASFAAMALMWSTISKSTVVAFIAAIGTWFLMPLLAVPGAALFIADVEAGAAEPQDVTDLRYEGWAYLSPDSAMRAAVTLLVPDDEGFFLGIGFIPQATRPVWAAASLVGWTAIFLGITAAVTVRKDFD